MRLPPSRALANGGRWLAFAATVAAAVWLFAVLPLVSADKLWGVPGSMLRWLTGSWSASEDMQHGWLVPLVSAYVIWSRRRELADCAGAPDVRGCLAVALGVAMVWIGLKAEQARIHVLALVWLFWAVPFALWGRAVARLLVFPAVFLLLTMPMGSVVTFFTVRLRLLAAAISGVLLSGVGIDVYRVGTGLHSLAGKGFNLDVADPCSGLRSIFALTALAAAYAFFTQKTLLRQWLLFACAVPLAVLGNVVRIVSIATVSRFFGQEAATGFYHDYSGYVVFVVAILLMIEAGTLIARIGKTPPPAPPPAAARGASTSLSGRQLALTVSVPALLLAAVLLARHQPLPVLQPIDFIAQNLPAQVGTWQGDQPWFCHGAQCLRSFYERELPASARLAGTTNAVVAAGTAPVGASAGAPATIAALMRQPSVYACLACGQPLYGVSLGEKDLLPGDTTVLKREYRDLDGEHLTVSLVISGASRDSIHKPENCLPAQGLRIERVNTLDVPMAGRNPLTMKRILVSRTLPDGRVLRQELVYWFVGSAHETAWHVERMFWTTWERAFHNRAVRWSYVSIAGDAPFDSEERVQRLQAFVQAWYPLMRNTPPAP